MTAVTHAVRSEREVAADAAMATVRALADANYVRLTADVMSLVAVAAGVSVGELRDADGRRERHMHVPPKARPTIAGGPPASTTTATPMLQSADVERLRCGRCGHTKPADDYAMCSFCRQQLRERQARARAQVKEDASSHRALVRAVAPATDLRLTEDKTGFELVCAACGEPIAKGQAVVCLSCFDGPRRAA